jgi:hypothetical protein
MEKTQNMPFWLLKNAFGPAFFHTMQSLVKGQ